MKNNKFIYFIKNDYFFYGTILITFIYAVLTKINLIISFIGYDFGDDIIFYKNILDMEKNF